MAEALPAAGNQRIMEDFARALDTANRAMVALDEISQQMRVLRDDKTVSPKLKTSKSRLLKTEGALLKATHSAAVASFTGINSLMRKRNNGQPPQQPERLLPSAGGLNGERATNVQEVDEDALLFEE